MSNEIGHAYMAELKPGQTLNIVTEKSSSSSRKLYIFGIFILFLIIAVIVYSSVTKSEKGEDPPVKTGEDSPVKTPDDVKLARPTKMGDCGYPNRPRGWYDTKKRGVRNDYCRYVGDWPGKWMCNVQGTRADGLDSVESELQYSESESFDPYQDTMQGFNCQ